MVIRYMFAAVNTAAAYIVLPTADSAAASPSTAPVGIQVAAAAENSVAKRSADIPTLIAATYSDT